MNRINEETRKDFISTFYFEKEYISFEEYNILESEGDENIGVEFDNVNEANGKYYKKIYKDFTKEELQEFVDMKSLDLSLRILNNLRTLNNTNKSRTKLMKYWIAISATNLFLVLWILIKLYKYIRVFP